MEQQLTALLKKTTETLKKLNTFKQVEEFETEILGRKGDLTNILRQIKNLSDVQKKVLGKKANHIKESIKQEFNQAKKALRKQETLNSLQKDHIDITEPGTKEPQGHLHPSSIVQYELEDIFTNLGFMVLDGPELESEFYNFEALNVPKHHPARDIQDTFWVDNGHIMRPQTSAVQVRAMEKYGAPLKAIVPGRTFRYEATDASHEHTFYQLEGLMIDKNLSISNLIATMKLLLSEIFKKDVEVRLRPGYFPFVEPGFELDIQCLICKGKGCSVCKKTGWLELLPCGMVHPTVLKAGGLDPNHWNGFAFGLGLTRLVMMKYNINDIRHLQSGDLRFINQF